MSSPSASSPLDRFPPEVRQAYDAFSANGDREALATVVQAIVKEFMPRPAAGAPRKPVEPGQRLIDDLGFDSIAIAEIVFFFEDLFTVTIDNKDLLTLQTVGDLCGYIERRVGPDRATP